MCSGTFKAFNSDLLAPERTILLLLSCYHPLAGNYQFSLLDAYSLPFQSLFKVFSSGFINWVDNVNRPVKSVTMLQFVRVNRFHNTVLGCVPLGWSRSRSVIQDLSGSWCIKGIGESMTRVDLPVPLIHHDRGRSWITDPDPDHPKGTQP